MAKAKKPSIRKRVFNAIRELGKTISRHANLYEVKKDFNKLPEKHKNRLTGGVKLYNEPVIKFTTPSEQLEILCTFKQQIEDQGYAFLPLFESENFIQGLMFRPEDETWIDAAWNRIFYPNHCVGLFNKGYDPTLAGFADILHDCRSGLILNWDSRHRAVGKLSADSTQLPDFGWSNALVIKSTAPTKGNDAIFADVVACWLFEQKNDTPKPLTPVERFVAEYRTNVPSAIDAYSAFLYAGLRLGTEVLPELESGHDARIITGISQFRSDYKHDNMGHGRHLVKASESLKKVWTGSQAPQFSVYLVLGYCHLLQMDSKYNGAWGFNNETAIAALKWAFTQKKLDPASYLSPRAQGKPYETVAFHFLRLAYNPYCQQVLNNEDEMLSFEHFGFKSSFLETIGLTMNDMKDKEDVSEESDYESINEALNTEPNFN